MSIKLLVADDSITIQKVIGIIFGGDDYSLTVVDNGKAAIEKAREICPDVLLIDALMPGMTGYEVSEAVRATPALANKPILILTGSFEPFDEDKAKKCGADDFMAKPFESQQIINKVKELAELGISREKASVVAQPAVASIGEPEQVQVYSAAAETFVEPETAQKTAVPSDIWGAFTTDEIEPAPVAPASLEVKAPQTAQPVEFLSEPDVFAIVSEESDSQIVQASAIPASSPQSTGSQWIPVEEHTFEFEEEAVPETPPAAFFKQEIPSPESSFGDISFEEEEPFEAGTVAAAYSTPEPIVPAQTFASAPEPAFPSFEDSAPFFAEPVPASEEPVQPFFESIPADSAPEPASTLDAPSAVAAPVALTEEQLKAALSAASKEVIERIVWEVVPDLAEALIKEAIRKIKDGL